MTFRPKTRLQASALNNALSQTKADAQAEIAKTGANQIVVTQAGTSAIDRTLLSKVREAFHVDDFGAVGDGTTNDRAAIQAALNARSAAGGGVVNIGPKQYFIDGEDLIIPPDVLLCGGINPGGYHINAYNRIPYTITHTGVYTIRLRRNATVSGIAVIGRNLFSYGTFTTAAVGMAIINGMTGTGVTLGVAGATGNNASNATDAALERCIVIGFDICVATYSASRVRIDKILADGNNAILQNNSFDPSFITNITCPMIINGGQTWSSRIFNVTGAANNGSGAIRLTISPSGSGLAVSDLVSGYKVLVADVGGVPNAAGVWPITVSGANTIDLVGSTWGGAFTSGGSVNPPINWRPGTAIKIVGADATLVSNCFSNNYMVGYWIDDCAACNFVNCAGEGAGYAFSGNRGLYIGPLGGRCQWVGGSLSVYTHKIYSDGASFQVTGVGVGSSGANPCIVQTAGVLVLDGCRVEGDVSLSDAIAAFVMNGGDRSGMSLIGSATALLKTTLSGGRNSGATGGMTAPVVDLRVRNASTGAEISGVYVDPAFIRLLNTVRIIPGAGAPEGVVTAPVGSLYLRTDGGASTTLYVKQSGSSNTGWVAK